MSPRVAIICSWTATLWCYLVWMYIVLIFHSLTLTIICICKWRFSRPERLRHNSKLSMILLWRLPGLKPAHPLNKFTSMFLVTLPLPTWKFSYRETEHSLKPLLRTHLIPSRAALHAYLLLIHNPLVRYLFHPWTEISMVFLASIVSSWTALEFFMWRVQNLTTVPNWSATTYI